MNFVFSHLCGFEFNADIVGMFFTKFLLSLHVPFISFISIGLFLSLDNWPWGLCASGEKQAGTCNAES